MVVVVGVKYRSPLPRANEIFFILRSQERIVRT